MFDVNSPGGSFAFSNTTWPNMLALANQYGWEPQETNYFSNEGGLVCEEDAAALALALEKALDDIPDHDALAHKTKPIEGFPGMHIIDDDVSLIEYFSGPD